MNLSRIFILKPIATSLLMLALFLAGVLAYRYLPVSALPQIDYPTIQITTYYPGASADVMVAVVTAPLEKNLSSMPGLLQMNSVSSAGASVITLQFDLSISLDVAEQEVQAAINVATSLLPSDLPNPPVYNKVNPADPPILTLAATSIDMSLTEIEDIVDTRLAQKISQVSGVGLVTLSGGQKPAVRIQINPRALSHTGLTTEDIRAIISRTNVNGAKGSFDGPLRSSSIDANDQLASAEEYKKIIISYKDGAPLRLQDVANVIDGAENARLAAWVSRKENDNKISFSPAIVLSIQRQPGANVIQVVDNIVKLLPALQNTLPGNINISIITNRTETIRASMFDVEMELALSIALVILVIWLFLRNIRATIIPALSVPLSLVGSFGIMYVAGYSLNNLTLMALVIATGFVVDDAIVVIENISRYLEKGLTPLHAALQGAGQIGFTIISLTISLVAVLIPLLFMGDVTGRLFREFAVTLAATILISAIVSLTLTPMLCAIMLRHINKNQKKESFHKVIKWYDKKLNWVFKHQVSMLWITISTMCLAIFLYIIVDKGFFPVQDTGILQGILEVSQDTSFQGMASKQEEIANVIMSDSDVLDAVFFVGVDGINQSIGTSRFTLTLKPLAERTKRVQEIASRLMKKINNLPGFAVWIQPIQDLTIEDRISRSQYQFTVQMLNSEHLENLNSKIIQVMKTYPEVNNVSSDFQKPGRMAWLNINRDAASRFGVSMSDINNALYDALGQRLISTIFTQNNQYKVVLETAPEFRQNPSDIENIFVKANDGTVIPLSSIAIIEEKPTYLSINRQDQIPVATFSFDVSPGFSLGQSINALNRLSEDIEMLYSVIPQGSLKAYQHSYENQIWLIIAAIVTMYIVLGVLYESYIHPLTILSTLPSAGIGALLALIIAKMELGIVGIIGIILLIGIVKKNAIMMIDFALDAERNEHKNPLEAIHQACLLRLRPILMTTMAALLGALPLMIAWGVGSELRRPMGITMVGGLIVSQILTLFTTPVIYLWFERLVKRTQKNCENSENTTDV